MKPALFAAALMIGGAAFAQSTSTTTTTTTTSPATGTMTTQATTAQPAASAEQVAPSNQAPERDARGIPVVSDPATAPAGVNQPPAAAGAGLATPAQAFAPQPASEDYPACSRTVTDNCIQAYERGVRRPR